MPRQVVCPRPAAPELVDHLVGQGAAAGDQAHRALLDDRGGQDAQLGDTGSQQTGAVGADQPHAPLLQVGHDLDHVHGGHPFGDADDELAAGIRRFEDRPCGARRRHEDDRGVGALLGHRLLDRIVHRDPVHELLPAAAGGHPGHDLGPVGQHLAGVESAVPAGDALDDHLRRVVNKNRHVRILLFMAPAAPLNS